MDHKRSLFRVIPLLMAFILLLGAVPVDARSSGEILEEIEKLEADAEENQARMEALEQQLSDNFGQMEELVARKTVIDQQIALTYEQIANINSQIVAYAQLVADKQDTLDAAQADLDALNGKYKERIRAMEEQGSLSYWSVLFKANSFADLLDRINMVKEIAEADQRRMEEMTEAAQAVSDAKEALEAEKAVLEQTRQALVTAQAQLEEKRVQADAVLRELVARSEEFQALLDESELKQDALMEELAQSKADYDQAKYLEWLATYVPPVTEDTSPEVPESDADWITPVPYYTLTSPFGMRLHPILGYYRMHNGVDLACAAMTPIYASRGGQVEVAAYQEDGAGNYVQINHGDGFRSVYMHMTYYTVSPGEYVAPGQIIGYVGNTGLSKGDHLHFGISYYGEYVNPMEYIG